MDRQQAQKIVEGLRNAQVAKAPIAELQGDDARDFMFVTAESVVLGSFSVLGGAFFILIGTTYGGKDDFQFRAYRPRNKVVLTTNKTDDQGVVWGYSASLQDGKNALRKQTFRMAAGADSIVIPYPTADLTAFISAVTRAIELRGLAHAAGGDDADDEDAGEGESPVADARGLLARLFTDESERVAAAKLLAATVRVAHAVNPKSWCVTNPGGDEKIRLNVGGVRVLDLVPGMARLAVDGWLFDASARATLGDALDVSNHERLAAFGDDDIFEVPGRLLGAILMHYALHMQRLSRVRRSRRARSHGTTSPRFWSPSSQQLASRCRDLRRRPFTTGRSRPARARTSGTSASARTIGARALPRQ